MIPKSNRLTYPQFQNNPEHYSHHECPYLQMLTKRSANGGVRVVIIVPKRLDKRSVYRNKTKRKISEAILKKVVGDSQSFDILIKAKKIISKENEEIYLNHAKDLIKKCLTN